MVDEASPSSASSFEMLDMESVPPPYQEVQPHWFYCRRAEDNTSWLPFSKEDSDKLETAYCNGKYVLTCGLHTVKVDYLDRYAKKSTNKSALSKICVLKLRKSALPKHIKPKCHNFVLLQSLPLKSKYLSLVYKKNMYTPVV